MFDLTEELQSLVQMYRARADRRRGVALAFVGVTSGVGVSTCARAFSRLVAPNAKRGVWLFDLDFYCNEQYATFASAQAKRLYGNVGIARDPSLAMEPFWRVSPLLVQEQTKSVQSAQYLTIHQIGTHRLYVSRFQKEALRTGQNVHLVRAPKYWQRLRDAIDLGILDVPARDRSRSVLAIAPDVDGVILVAEHGADPQQLAQLQREIEDAGGTCLGLIYNTRQLAPNAPHWNTGS